MPAFQPGNPNTTISFGDPSPGFANPILEPDQRVVAMGIAQQPGTQASRLSARPPVISLVQTLRRHFHRIRLATAHLAGHYSRSCANFTALTTSPSLSYPMNSMAQRVTTQRTCGRLFSVASLLCPKPRRKTAKAEFISEFTGHSTKQQRSRKDAVWLITYLRTHFCRKQDSATRELATSFQTGRYLRPDKSSNLHGRFS